MHGVTGLFAVMELIRKRVNKDMPIQHVALLLAVAETPGITMPELMSTLKMPQGSVSRNIKVLSGYVESKDGIAVTKGYNLLRTAPDLHSPRVLAVYLTADGEALVRDMVRLAGAGKEDETAIEKSGLARMPRPFAGRWLRNNPAGDSFSAQIRD